MIRRILLSIIVLFPLFVGAQTVVDSISYGDNTIQWRVYESDGPVIAFTVTPKKIWYSIGTSVATYDLKTNKKRTYPKLGTVSSEGIKTMTNDKKGNVWFGGPGGAVVVMGGKFKNFTKKNGLASNNVNTITCTKNATWIGTDKGVTCYNRGSLKSYTVSEGLTGNDVRGIVVDNNGGIWLATNKGVTLLKNEKFIKYDMKSGLSWNDSKAIAYDARTEIIWVAVGEQDVNSFNGKEWNTYMDIQMGITSIMSDTQSRLWFGSSEGIIKYNGFEWVSDPAKIGFPAAQVMDMYRDGRGDLYFALETGVLHMTNPYPF